ncbi:M56 family metallopeptidase [Candidatus Palauibacter sp.]|uniref:M56 family metallopeptidase n=1 Tax=Candidatus Palauibacter sp. TaxID=3101350 RepID=UPI003B01C331
MTDLALQIAGTKLAISVVLGGAAWLVARDSQRPRLCHAICLTLMAALLIPPLIAIPVLQTAAPAAGPAGAALTGTLAIGNVPPLAPRGPSDGPWFAGHGSWGFVLLWLCGAIAVLGWTLARMRRFRRFMQGASREAPPALRRMAEELARTLGLAKVPAIHTTDALVSPMACWSGAAVRVLIPSALLTGLERSELRWIVAHELAHVRRRDHLVRWLEWLACTAFWWNPIAWWARRKLRAAGEVCCDALVVRAFGCAPRAYARALVRAIDLVRTERTQRPPVFASAADSGRRTRLLERRLRMIVTNRPASTLPRALRLVLRGGLVASLALGLVYCSEQASLAAVEVPTPDAPPAHLTADLQFADVSAADVQADEASWSWYVPTGPDAPGMVVVSGSAPLPTVGEQQELLAAIAELPEGSPERQFLVARRISDVPYRDVSELTDVASRKFKVVRFRSLSPGLEVTMTGELRLSDETGR